MKPKISIVTLAVDDMARAVAFYRDGLGFPMHNYADGDDFAMFRLEGAWLALHPRAADATPGIGLGYNIAHNEPSPEGVDAVFAEALAAGASVVQTPQAEPWGGYAGCFADPDGHRWDICYNPFTDLT